MGAVGGALRENARSTEDAGGGSQRGKVQFFSAMKGFGRIARDDFNDTVFFGLYDLVDAHGAHPEVGDRVEFVLEDDQHGRPKAVRVKVLQ